MAPIVPKDLKREGGGGGGGGASDNRVCLLD